MRAAYTRTASPQCWMRWCALANTRTASAHFFFFFALDVLACACIPGLRPRSAGCTGMRAAYTRTAPPHRWMRWHALACTRTASAPIFFFLNRHAHAPCRICCIGSNWHARAYTRTASARYRVHWHAHAYTRTASLRCRYWMHWYAFSIRQDCTRAQHNEREMFFKAEQR